MIGLRQVSIALVLCSGVAPASLAEIVTVRQPVIEFKAKEEPTEKDTDMLMDPDTIEEYVDIPEDSWLHSDTNKTRPEQRKKKKNKIKVKIQDYPVCVPGLERINSCRSNPDQTKCDDGSYPIDRQVLDLKGRLLTQYRYCPGDPPIAEFPEENIIERIAIDIKKFRSYPIKGSKIQSTPNKFSLRNGHTHFWASNETQEFKSEISEADVRIKAIPIQWNWNYGDGATRNLNFPGEAMPSHTLREETKTSHSYTKTGKFGVRVTTLYRGEFSVDGGPWQAIPGQAAVPSNTLPMDVWRTKKELIAND